MKKLLYFSIVLSLLLLTGCSNSLFSENQNFNSDTDSISVAFIGDGGVTDYSKEVLNLIKSEGADFVIHSGDFDYVDDPVQWDKQITDILGDDYPYFANVGNHDYNKWSGQNGYQHLLVNRLAKIPNATCVGEYGVTSSCNYKGLFFILSGVGTMGPSNEDAAKYISRELQGSNTLWELCTWHKNMNAMQLGDKGDETGWEVYEACKEEGALIFTGHEHSYSRTHMLSSVKNQIVVDNSSPYDFKKGQTIVVVSGIAGRDIRNQDRCLPKTYPYGCNGEWASIYTSDQGAKPGVLFCTFGVDDQINKANCYFKNIDGNVIDQYFIINE